MESKTYFEDIEHHILDFLDGAQQDITIAVAKFSNAEIFQKLCSKASQGVPVKLAIPDSATNRKPKRILLQELVDAGGELFWIPLKKAKTLSQQQYCVIDRTQVLTGSYNWSQHKGTTEANIMIFSDADELASQYLEIFNNLLRINGYKIKSIPRIDSKSILKRLELIRNMIALGEYEDIRLQVDKLRTMSQIEALNEIIEQLDKQAFKKASQHIVEFIQQKKYQDDITKNSDSAANHQDIEELKKKKIILQDLFFRYPELEFEESSEIPWNDELLDLWVSSDLLIDWKEISSEIEINDDFDTGLFSEKNFPRRALKLIDRYKDEWDWKELSGNQYFSWSVELIKKYMDMWDWAKLSKNGGIPKSIDFIERFEEQLTWDELSSQNDDAERFLDYFEYIDCNTDTLKQYVLTFSIIPWNIELIERFKKKWNWSLLSSNEFVPWSTELVDKYLDMWDWSTLSGNDRAQEHIPWNEGILEKHKDELDWWAISRIYWTPWSIELIEKYADKWDWSMLSGNRSLPWNLDLIEKYEGRWDWSILSGNRSLPWNLDLIGKYEGRWDWSEISFNQSWIATLIDKYEEKLNWRNLSYNHYIPWSVELIDMYKDKWEWRKLTDNRAVPQNISFLDLPEEYRDEFHYIYEFEHGEEFEIF